MALKFDKILGELRELDAGNPGTVTSVSVTTANGVSGTVATATTTPAISLSLGAITPSSVNAVVLSGSATPTLSVTGTSSISGSNTGDNATNSQYSGLVTNATHTGDATGSGALTVVALNGTNLAGLATGVLKNTTTTGVPFISKVALTEPATAATLTIADNQTLTVNGSATITNGTHSGTNTGDQTTVSGNAGSATTVAVTDDTSTNATMYPTWVTTTTGNLPVKVSSTKLTFNPTTGLTLTDLNLALGTTTGTKIGTATTQKLSFYNSTPIVQPTATTDLGTVLSNLGLRAAGTAYPLTTSGAVTFTGNSNIRYINMTSTDSTYNDGQIRIKANTYGATQPQVRFVGAVTPGGVMMSSDGLLEFFNNYDAHGERVAGQIGGTFRFDTRAGYETDSFLVVGQKTTGGVHYIMASDLNTADTVFASWGAGSVGVGDSKSGLGMTGNGNFYVKNNIVAGGTLNITGTSTLGDITMTNGKNIAINTTTGTKIGTGTTQKIGFWNATPVVQSTGWGATNVSSDKGYDANATTIDELADVLGSLIDQLKTYGILGA